MSSNRKSQTVDVVSFLDEDEESEEPPKPEVKEVQEKDAFYSKKWVSSFVVAAPEMGCLSSLDVFQV